MEFFAFIDDNDYGEKRISRKLNNGDFDYWLVMEDIDLHEATGVTDQPRYNVCISAVAPSEINDKDIQAVMAKKRQQSSQCECCGVDKANDPLLLVELIHAYGISAIIWQKNGNNLRQLRKEARKRADIQGDSLFGFSMDRPQNAIGTTGWEMIRGDLLAPFNR